MIGIIGCGLGLGRGVVGVVGCGLGLWWGVVCGIWFRDIGVGRRCWRVKWEGIGEKL